MRDTVLEAEPIQSSFSHESETPTQLALMMREAEQLLYERASRATRQWFLDHPGKLLRPRLTFACARFGSGRSGTADWAMARTGALAIELAHLGTLYHDDIVDRSARRRGGTAIHRQLGTRSAALGGAELLMCAQRLSSSLPNELSSAWGRAASRVADGQLRELDNAGNPHMTPDAYLRIAELKTAALFELAAAIGAFASSCADATGLHRFAKYFGIAYQLADDLVDFASVDESHRPANNDLTERNYTLPVLLAMSDGDPSLREALSALLIDDGYPIAADGAVRIHRLLLEGGAFRRAAGFVDAEKSRASAILDELSRAGDTAELRALLSLISIPDGLVV